MNAEDLEEGYRILQGKRAAGEIREEEYWEELLILERRLEEFEDHGRKETFDKAVLYRAFGLFLFVIPIVIAGIFFYLLHCYSPVPEGITIEVHGVGILPATSEEKEGIYRGLVLMREHSDGDYAFVATYVDTVEISGPLFSVFPGERVGGYYRGGPDGFGKNVRIVRGFECPAHCSEEGWSGLDLLVAEILLHEACHSMQHHTGVPITEAPCYGMQFDFMRRVGPKLWSDFEEEKFLYTDPLSGFL